MRLVFLPGELLCDIAEDGLFRVSIQNKEVIRTKSQRIAVQRFNELRKEMEERFPLTELTAEEKAEMLQRAIGDSLVGHNSLGGRKKKTTAGGTRTFGG
jgi:hypothetical protein